MQFHLSFLVTTLHLEKRTWCAGKSFESQNFRNCVYFSNICSTCYSHLSNNRGGWNKRVGGAKVAKSLNVEGGINVEAGHFKKIIKRRGGKTYLINVEGGTYL